MLADRHNEHIQSLEGELTVISRARDDINSLLKERLPRKDYLEIAAEIAGILMFVQKGLHNRILRLKERRD